MGVVPNLSGSFTYMDTTPHNRNIERSYQSYETTLPFGGVNQANKITAKWKRKLENRKRLKAGTAVIDLAATSNFWREEDEHIATANASDKVGMIPTGVTTNASKIQQKA